MSLCFVSAVDIAIELIGELKARFPHLDVLDAHGIVYP
jgi:hypothetical protein